MLAAVGASGFADTRIGLLSGGQQQRVLIAHAIISSPALLLLDEPLANLDISSAQEIVELLAQDRSRARDRRAAVRARPQSPAPRHGSHRLPGRRPRGDRSDGRGRAVGCPHRRCTAGGSTCCASMVVCWSSRGRTTRTGTTDERRRVLLRQRTRAARARRRSAGGGRLRAGRGLHGDAAPVLRGTRARRPRRGGRFGRVPARHQPALGIRRGRNPRGRCSWSSSGSSACRAGMSPRASSSAWASASPGSSSTSTPSTPARVTRPSRCCSARCS